MSMEPNYGPDGGTWVCGRCGVPLEQMKKVYYRARGWKKGIPTWHRLKSLGIQIDKTVYDAAVEKAWR